MTFVLSAICTLVTISQRPIDIRFQPDQVVYVYENRGVGNSKTTYSALIQNVAFVNISNKPLNLTGYDLEVYQDGKRRQTKHIQKQAVEEAIEKVNFYKEQGYLELIEPQFQLKSYLSDAELAASSEMRPSEAVIISHQVLLFDEVPDSIVVRAYTDEGSESSATLLVEDYTPASDYVFPLKGSWFAAAGPSLIGHHRWVSLQEFALDLIQVGEGTSSHQNQGAELSDYYAYGSPVYSIADGEVVSILSELEESTEMLKKSNESEIAYMKRTIQMQQKLLMKGFKYIMGNHVIIKHNDKEYSYYLHLKPGSIQVKVGEKVMQGQQVAELGNSGNSTEPHLHFHLADGPSVEQSRSLPISFKNVRLFPDDDGAIKHIHSGQILKAE